MLCLAHRLVSPALPPFLSTQSLIKFQAFRNLQATFLSSAESKPVYTGYGSSARKPTQTFCDAFYICGIGLVRTSVGESRTELSWAMGCIIFAWKYELQKAFRHNPVFALKMLAFSPPTVTESSQSLLKCLCDILTFFNDIHQRLLVILWVILPGNSYEYFHKHILNNFVRKFPVLYINRMWNFSSLGTLFIWLNR